MLDGQTITLYSRTQTGTDGYGAPVYTETAENVADVLIGQPSAEEKITSVNLYGRAVEYVLGIPKDDSHEWNVGQVVQFFGEKFVIIALPETGIQSNIPLRWGKNIRVARYE